MRRAASTSAITDVSMAKGHDKECKYWCMVDSKEFIKNENKKLPLESLNHLAREVLCVEKSRKFYCDILGFQEVVRPSLKGQGVWLHGYGIGLHLIATSDPEERRRVRSNRITHFTLALPRVDHIAFVAKDISIIQERLDAAKIFYIQEAPTGLNMKQLFFFDPDGNVIEVSNCGIDVGETVCKPRVD